MGVYICSLRAQGDLFTQFSRLLVSGCSTTRWKGKTINLCLRKLWKSTIGQFWLNIMGKCPYLIIIPPVLQTYFIWKCWLIWFRLRSFSRKGPYGLAMPSRPTSTFTLRKWSTSSRIWRTTWWVNYQRIL